MMGEHSLEGDSAPERSEMRRKFAEELGRECEAELRQYIARLAAVVPRGPARDRWLAEIEESMAAVHRARKGLATGGGRDEEH